MTVVSDSQLELAAQAVDRANKLGSLVYSVAAGLFWVLTGGMVIGLFAVFYANNFNRENSYTDWSAVWLGWGSLIGAWLLYSFGLALIALVGAVAQAKAESLDLQISLAQE